MLDPIPVKLYNYGDATIEEVGYYSDGTPALMIIGDDGVPISKLTVCMDTSLEPGEFLIKTWSENKQITEELLKKEIFVDTGKRVSNEFVTASVWRVKR